MEEGEYEDHPTTGSLPLHAWNGGGGMMMGNGEGMMMGNGGGGMVGNGGIMMRRMGRGNGGGFVGRGRGFGGGMGNGGGGMGRGYSPSMRKRGRDWGVGEGRGDGRLNSSGLEGGGVFKSRKVHSSSPSISASSSPKFSPLRGPPSHKRQKMDKRHERGRRREDSRSPSPRRRGEGYERRKREDSRSPSPRSPLRGGGRRRGYERSPSPRGRRGGYERSPSPRGGYERRRGRYERSPSPRGERGREGGRGYERSPSPRGRYDRSPSPRRGRERSFSPSRGRDRWRGKERGYGRSLSPRRRYDRSSSPRRGRERSLSPRKGIGREREQRRGRSPSPRGRGKEKEGENPSSLREEEMEMEMEMETEMEMEMETEMDVEMDMEMDNNHTTNNNNNNFLPTPLVYGDVSSAPLPAGPPPSVQTPPPLLPLEPPQKIVLRERREGGPSAPYISRIRSWRWKKVSPQPPLHVVDGHLSAEFFHTALEMKDRGEGEKGWGEREHPKDPRDPPSFEKHCPPLLFAPFGSPQNLPSSLVATQRSPFHANDSFIEKTFSHFGPLTKIKIHRLPPPSPHLPPSPIISFEYKIPRDGVSLLSISRGNDNNFPWSVRSDPDGSLFKSHLQRSPSPSSLLHSSGESLHPPSFFGDSLQNDSFHPSSSLSHDPLAQGGGRGDGFEVADYGGAFLAKNRFGGGVGGYAESYDGGFDGPEKHDQQHHNPLCFPYHHSPFPTSLPPFHNQSFPGNGPPFLHSSTSLPNMPQYPPHMFSKQSLRPGILGDCPDSVPDLSSSPSLLSGGGSPKRGKEYPNNSRGGGGRGGIGGRGGGGQDWRGRGVGSGREVSEKKGVSEKERGGKGKDRPSFLFDFEETIRETAKETVSSAAAVKDPQSVEQVMEEVFFDLVSSVYEDTKKQCADAVIVSYYHAWNVERLKSLSLGPTGSTELSKPLQKRSSLSGIQNDLNYIASLPSFRKQREKEKRRKRSKEKGNSEGDEEMDEGEDVEEEDSEEEDVGEEELEEDLEEDKEIEDEEIEDDEEIVEDEETPQIIKKKKERKRHFEDEDDIIQEEEEEEDFEDFEDFEDEDEIMPPTKLKSKNNRRPPPKATIFDRMKKRRALKEKGSDDEFEPPKRRRPLPSKGKKKPISGKEKRGMDDSEEENEREIEEEDEEEKEVVPPKPPPKARPSKSKGRKKQTLLEARQEAFPEKLTKSYDTEDFSLLDEEDRAFLRMATRDVLFRGEDIGCVVPEYPFLFEDQAEEKALELAKQAENAVLLGSIAGIATDMVGDVDLSVPLASLPPHEQQKRIQELQKVQEKLRKNRRVHKTGCARTEGHYRIRPEDKWYTQRGLLSGLQEESSSLFPHEGPKKEVVEQSASRRANTSKRQLTALRRQAEEVCGDHLTISDLRYRGKRVKFGKSRIHDWGLFALDRIEPNEMVIEYIGEVVREKVADTREARYVKKGMGSSYMFRIDDYEIIDATKKGNLARFINHCCDPNCSAKVITVQGNKKICIYSSRVIEPGEEVTYDYKFAEEEEKIKCLCKSPKCRGTLN